MHGLNPRKGATRTPEWLEAQHRSHHTLYGSMVLLHDITEILRLSNDNGRLVGAVVTIDCGGVASALIGSVRFRAKKTVHNSIEYPVRWKIPYSL